MIISPMAWVSISGSADLCAMNYRLSSRPSESNSPVDLLMKSKLDTFKIRGVGGEKLTSIGPKKLLFKAQLARC